MQKKSFNSPDETKSLPKTKLEIVKIGEKTLIHTTFEQGWKWSVDIKPAVGTESCQAHHVLFGISGKLKAVLEDGSEEDVSPGDVVDIPPGHDAWVVGDEPFVALDIT
jgi:hypothetical protein